MQESAGGHRGVSCSSQPCGWILRNQDGTELPLARMALRTQNGAKWTGVRREPWIWRPTQRNLKLLAFSGALTHLLFRAHVLVCLFAITHTYSINVSLSWRVVGLVSRNKLCLAGTRNHSHPFKHSDLISKKIKITTIVMHWVSQGY